MGTLDARLIALDRINGEVLWNAEVGDVALANSVTMAPLAVKDKVIVGVGGGNSEYEATSLLTMRTPGSRPGKPIPSRAGRTRSRFLAGR